MKKNFLVLLILLVAGFLRFYNTNTSLGYEWDEPVYAQVSHNTAIGGYPSDNQGPYLYHPPFDFYLKGFLYSILNINGTVQEISAGRILSSIESVLELVIAYFCLSEVIGYTGAVIGLLLLATDGWLIYTAKLNLIENGMMLYGTLGIWMYILATKRERTVYYLLSGFFLAFAAVYKHTGIPFLAVPIINFMITRKAWRNHLRLLLIMVAVLLTYVFSMAIMWPNDYVFQTWVQVERAIGDIGSRGLNYGLDSVVTAIYQMYWVFAATIIAIAFVCIIGIYRTFRTLTGEKPYNSVFLSWAISTFVFLIGIALKAPHYLVIVLVPGYMFIASELKPFYDNLGVKRVIAICIILPTLVANLYTWNVRFLRPYDNALLETFQFFQTVPKDTRVLADDCVIAGIEQKAFNIDRNSSIWAIEAIKPNYIVIYTSITQEPPTSEDLQKLIAESEVVQMYRGFKEVIKIYKFDWST